MISSRKIHINPEQYEWICWASICTADYFKHNNNLIRNFPRCFPKPVSIFHFINDFHGTQKSIQSPKICVGRPSNNPAILRLKLKNTYFFPKIIQKISSPYHFGLMIIIYILLKLSDKLRVNNLLIPFEVFSLT